jgi:hypothetical protein
LSEYDYSGIESTRGRSWGPIGLALSVMAGLIFIAGLVFSLYFLAQMLGD